MNRNNTLTRQLLFCLSFGLLPLLNANTSSLQASKPDAPKNQKKIYQKGWIDFNKNGKKYIYEDPSQPIDKRVEDLLKQMTVEEKTCQLGTIYGYGAVLKDTLPTDEWKTRIWKDGIGNIDEHLNGEWKRTSLDFPYSNHAEAMNKVQAFFVEETRLGIPADLTNEGIRGLKHEKSTFFPAQIGQGCTWDKELIYEIGDRKSVV